MKDMTVQYGHAEIYVYKQFVYMQFKKGDFFFKKKADVVAV